jgi:hypothetical protein
VEARRHVLAFRLLLLTVLAASTVHCGDEETQPSCGGCDCADVPGDDDSSDDDDSSAIVSDDDDVVDDDDSVIDDPTLDLPACEGSVLAAFTLAEIDPPGPDSDPAYLVPGDDTLEAVSASVQTLIGQGDAELAIAQVAVVGYELCRGEGDEAGTALWRPITAGSGRALFAWRAVGARPLIIGVPHASYDLSTLAEGVAMFDQLDARALIAAGTHRCAHPSESGCDGTTSVCGDDDAPHLVSDMAHSGDTVFQVAHELLSDLFETDQVLSVHGMSGDGVSVSNGTTDPTATDSSEAVLAAALAAALPGEYVTVCNEHDGATLDPRLCGTTNVQGRYVNGSAAPCTQEAPAASHRFWHLEQSLEIRNDADAVIQAIGSVLP